MKEMNINIQGYNVNGICLGCLNCKRNMFRTFEATECFKTLADINVADGLSIQVCWECLAYVRQVKRFQEQILRSYDILLDYSSKQTFPNSPQDLSLKAAQRLKTTEPTVLSISKESEMPIPILPELKKESINKEELMDVKTEIDDDYMELDLEPVEPESEYNNQEAFQDNITSSDEDIQLSKLKKKNKGGKIKKKRKNNGKEVKILSRDEYFENEAIPYKKISEDDDPLKTDAKPYNVISVSIKPFEQQGNSCKRISQNDKYLEREAKSEISENNECDSMPPTPPDIQNEAKSVLGDPLPPKSKEKYLVAYQKFIQWKTQRKAKSFSENVFLAYFSGLVKIMKPTSLWRTYSMLKRTVYMNHNLNIKNYSKLLSMLRRQSVGFESKKSAVFTVQNVEQFLNEAPDDIYLAMKVILIFGIYGACKCNEFVNFTINDIEIHEDIMVITIRDSETKKSRTFTVRDQTAIAIVRKYRALRPGGVKTERFFVTYKKGRCIKQVIGRNIFAAVPKRIASYLRLNNPEHYTGHCLRRSSATLLDETGTIIRPPIPVTEHSTQLLTVPSISKESETKIPISPELKKESIIKEGLMDFKIEIDDDFMEFDLEPKESESEYNNQEAFQNNVTSSDEDIQLSKLKNMEKKIKKKKQNNRKEVKILSSEELFEPDAKRYKMMSETEDPLKTEAEPYNMIVSDEQYEQQANSCKSISHSDKYLEREAKLYKTISESEDSYDSMPPTPPDILNEAKSVMGDLLPPKSKERYLIAYERFIDWKTKRNAKSFSENVFLAYFSDLAKTMKPSSIWGTYSMLKRTVYMNHNLNIKNYSKLLSMLRRQSVGFESKKSEVFTVQNVEQFLNEAPDDLYLAMKVSFYKLEQWCRN